MFQEITPEEALIAIKQLIKEGDLKKTTYAVWWKGKFISPSAVISKHFQLIKNPIDSESFDTSQAQKTLLNLGFPIVDLSREDGFFTEKELNSFDILVNNRYYDKDNPLDKNIGEFISQIIWGKTKIWREKLLELGWFKDNNRYNWQTQSNSKKGNIYKHYTWFKVFPDANISKLVFFTIGVGGGGNLYYKVDIKRSDDFFKKSKKIKEFELLLDSTIIESVNYAEIKKENIEQENWTTLIEKTDVYFTKKRNVLEKITSHFWPEKRLMRLVWNDKDWRFPIKRDWKKKWQGKKNKAHHEQYGFGFEDWLFNKRYLIDGYRYGYIRGVASMPIDISFIDQLYLYSIDPVTKQQFLVGKLENVEVYHEIDEVEDHIVDIFENNRNLMLEELKTVKADTKLLKTLELWPNMSFRMDDATIYQEPILINQDVLKIHRFIPRIIDDELEFLIGNVDDAFKNPKLKFESGNSTGSNSYSQDISGGKRKINRTHADITNDLHEYLTNSKTYKNFEISTEKTRVSNNLVDCAAKRENEYILFEVKTANSVLANIRQALGQIIEYALLDTSLSIKKLVIIGPAVPTKNDLIYFQNLKEKLHLPLQYWSYSFEKDKLLDKFTPH